MRGFVQLIIAAACGTIAGFITDALGYASPWPVVIGVLVGLVVLGVSVVFIEDPFD